MDWFLFAFISAILAATSVIFEKKSLLREHAMQFSAVLALFNLAISLPFFLVIDYSWVTFELLLLIYGASVLATIAFLLVIKSVRHMDVSLSSPLLVLAPAFTAVTAYVALGERLGTIQIGGIGLLIIGSYVLETKPHQSLLTPIKEFKNSKYVHFILLALLFYSITSVVDRYVLSSFDVQPMAYLAFAHVFIAINFFVLIYIFHDGIRDIKVGLKKAGWIIFFVSILTVGHRLAQVQAMQLAFAGLVIAVKRMSAFFVVIIGGELFHEKNLLRKSIACLIMLGGAALIVL